MVHSSMDRLTKSLEHFDQTLCVSVQHLKLILKYEASLLTHMETGHNFNGGSNCIAHKLLKLRIRLARGAFRNVQGN